MVVKSKKSLVPIGIKNVFVLLIVSLTKSNLEKCKNKKIYFNMQLTLGERQVNGSSLLSPTLYFGE